MHDVCVFLCQHYVYIVHVVYICIGLDDTLTIVCLCIGLVPNGTAHLNDCRWAYVAYPCVFLSFRGCLCLMLYRYDGVTGYDLDYGNNDYSITTMKITTTLLMILAGKYYLLRLIVFIMCVYL